MQQSKDEYISAKETLTGQQFKICIASLRDRSAVNSGQVGMNALTLTREECDVNSTKTNRRSAAACSTTKDSERTKHHEDNIEEDRVLVHEVYKLHGAHL